MIKAFCYLPRRLDHSQLWKQIWSEVAGAFPFWSESKKKIQLEKSNKLYLPNSVIWCPSLQSCFNMYWAWFRPWLLDIKSANNTIFMLLGALEFCKSQPCRNEGNNYEYKQQTSIYLHSHCKVLVTLHHESQMVIRHETQTWKKNNLSAAKFKFDLP